MLNTTDMSYIAQNFIADGGKVNKFAVTSSPDFKNRDWLSEKKFIEMNKLASNKSVVEYQLKPTLKGNLDENKRSQVGKAVKLEFLEKEIKIEVYTQVFGKSWSLSHTHVLERELYEAYVRVFLNNTAVDLVETEKRSPKNFTLDLG